MKHAISVNVSLVWLKSERIPFYRRKELDLTEPPLMPIIVCTSILRRSKQSGTLALSLCGLPGWRKNIYLLPAVLFPHLVRA